MDNDKAEPMTSTRQYFKRLIKNIFIVTMYPIYLIHLGLSRIGDKDGTFQSFSQGLSLIPGKLGIYIRAAFYRLACPGTSDEILIGFLTVLSHQNTTIERGVYIGPQCNIGKCTIKADTLLGSGVHILSGKSQHNFESMETPIQEQGGTYTKIEIGHDCWLGNGSIVMANVANHSIIAAGTVVTQAEVDEGSIFAGNPARLIKNRSAQIDQPTT